MVFRQRSFFPSQSGWRQGMFVSASCRNTSGLDAVVPHCTTRFENAHGTVLRELLYPWHPWFELQVAIHEAIEKADGVVFRHAANLLGDEGRTPPEIIDVLGEQMPAQNRELAGDRDGGYLMAFARILTKKACKGPGAFAAAQAASTSTARACGCGRSC